MSDEVKIPEAFLAAAREYGFTVDDAIERGMRLAIADRLPLEMLTPRVRRCLMQSAQLAEAHGHEHIGTEHLLLALLDDPVGIAGSTLRRHDADGIRADLIGVFASSGYSPND
jgi:hypothetical protein